MRRPDCMCVGLVILLAVFAAGRVRGEGAFALSAGDSFEIVLGERVIAASRTPEAFSGGRRVSAAAVFSVLGADHRQEFAWFADRLEYTYDFHFAAPFEPWRILFLALDSGDEAEIIHGTYEKPARSTLVRAADLPESVADVPAVGLRQVRYIRVQGERGAWSLDCWPRGAMGFMPSDAGSASQCLDVRPIPGGLELRAVLPAARAAYAVRMRDKFIFYADGREYRRMHPYDIMNYRFAFDRVVKLDFCSRPPPKKAGSRQPVACEPYTAEAGMGWISDPAAVSLFETSLGTAELVGEHVSGSDVGRFRIDLPAGHYYVTLNLGSADAATGPMSVAAGGEVRLRDVALAPGRFKAEVFWVTVTEDALVLEFTAAAGQAWRVGGLTVSSLGTLEEDFTLVRPWWHVAE